MRPYKLQENNLPNESKIYKTTAIKKSNNEYEDFGINKNSASIYGHKPEDIISIEFKISDNQTKPKNNKSKISDYWAWFDFEENKFTLIYPNYVVLNTAFPYGLDVVENKRKEGKAYRIEITKESKI